MYIVPYFSETRFRNLGVRSHVADQNFVFLSLNLFRLESGILDRRNLGERVALLSRHESKTLDKGVAPKPIDKYVSKPDLLMLF